MDRLFTRLFVCGDSDPEMVILRFDFWCVNREKGELKR